jgi:hypothetical protein
MVFVPSAQERKQKYLNSLGAVPGNYKAGIERTSNWKESALNGQALYEQQMQNAQVLRRRAIALERTSEADWKSRASNLGSVRIADGMRNGADKQTQNYEPIAQALRGVSLPDRTADPMANIDNRVKPIVRAMIEASPKNQ